MEKLNIICDVCLTEMAHIIKEKININDYLLKEHNDQGDIEIKSVFTCECGNNILPLNENIIINE